MRTPTKAEIPSPKIITGVTKGGKRWRGGLIDRALMNRVKRAFGGRCWRCNSPRLRFLEFAHIKPTPLCGRPRGRGMRDRYLDIRKNPDCYVLLCRWCHRVFDTDRAQGLETATYGGPPLPQIPPDGTPAEDDPAAEAAA